MVVEVVTAVVVEVMVLLETIVEVVVVKGVMDVAVVEVAMG